MKRATLRTWCCECGHGATIDEDGCCLACGNGAVGYGAERAVKNAEALAALRAKVRRLRAERSVLRGAVGHAEYLLGRLGQVDDARVMQAALAPRKTRGTRK